MLDVVDGRIPRMPFDSAHLDQAVEAREVVDPDTHTLAALRAWRP